MIPVDVDAPRDTVPTDTVPTDTVPTATVPADIDSAHSQELVRRALAGSSEAYAELSRRYGPRLRSFLLQRMDGIACDADDIVQETFARAFQQLPRFDARYQFSTWLYTIAGRLARDRERRLRRERRHMQRYAAAAVRPGPSADTGLDGVHESPGSTWHLARRILSDTQYSALWLRYAEDLPVAEIARALGKCQIAIRVALHRARQILLRELDRQQHTLWSPTSDEAPGATRRC